MFVDQFFLSKKFFRKYIFCENSQNPQISIPNRPKFSKIRENKACFPTKTHWFSVVFKDNLETRSRAEACLSFTECSEQCFGSLETQSRQQKKIWTTNIFSSRRKHILKIFFEIFVFKIFVEKNRKIENFENQIFWIFKIF